MTRLTVVYATLGRAEILRSVLANLARQTRPPEAVIVSAVTSADTVGLADSPVRHEVIYGTKGLCAQRNRALAAIGDAADIVLFLDDDFLPADDYLAELVALFDLRPELAGATGRVIADGIKMAGYSFEDGLRLIAEDVRPTATTTPAEALYGCNMAIRVAAARGLTFDEHMPFYGWLEDIDFTYRLGRRGPLVKCNRMAGVHLATKGGRTSGRRFGYSQIANPVYMLQKDSIPRALAFRQMARNVASNVVRVFHPEPWVDRRGRLMGNLLGFRDLLTGRLHPERILTMD